MFFSDPKERSVALAYLSRIGDCAEALVDGQRETPEPLHHNWRRLGVHCGKPAEELSLYRRGVGRIVRGVQTTAHLVGSLLVSCQRRLVTCTSMVVILYYVIVNAGARRHGL